MDDVLAANAAFYAAFNRKDADAMDALWAAEGPVACIHPGWEPLEGRPEVMRSWRGILKGNNAPRIVCEHPVAHVMGAAAFVVCTERVPGGSLVATNVFVREERGWKMTHHHSSALPNKPEREGFAN